MSTPAWLRLGATAGAAALLSTALATPATAQDGDPELLLKTFEFADPVDPSDLVSYQPTIHNDGDATAQVILLELFDHRYAHHVTRFSNCGYVDHSEGTSTAACQFEIDLAPGETAQVPETTAVDLEVQANVPDQFFINANYTTSAFSSPLPELPGELGDGPDLELVKVDDADLGDAPQVNFGNVILTAGPQATDLAAVGAEIDGEVGDQVTVELGLTNHSPADLVAPQPGEGPPLPPHLTISFPAGVTVLEILAPEGDLQFTSGCFPVIDGEADRDRRNEADGLEYACFVSELRLQGGESWLFPFRVEITDPAADDGTVEATTHPNDPDPSNNVAPIVLTGQAASPAPDPLPVTGSRTLLIAGAGLLVLLAGAGLYLVARPRWNRLGRIS